MSEVLYGIPKKRTVYGIALERNRELLYVDYGGDYDACDGILTIYDPGTGLRAIFWEAQHAYDALKTFVLDVNKEPLTIIPLELVLP